MTGAREKLRLPLGRLVSRGRRVDVKLLIHRGRISFFLEIVFHKAKVRWGIQRKILLNYAENVKIKVCYVGTTV